MVILLFEVASCTLGNTRKGPCCGSALDYWSRRAWAPIPMANDTHLRVERGAGAPCSVKDHTSKSVGGGEATVLG
jgi:hypothetical protein